MTHSTSSYDWVREIKPELMELDENPLLGAVPAFPWGDLAARLSTSFERSPIQIEPGEIEWRSQENLYEGLGDSLFPLVLSIPTIRGSIYWVMPEQELNALEALLLTKESHPISFQDQELSQSFYRFLALEVLYNISQTSFDKSLVPILSNQSELPSIAALCWDIKIVIQQNTLWGRLIIPNEFRQSWVTHFAKNTPSALTKELAQKVDVIIHIEAGQTQLTLKEWETIQLGDLVSLDQCTLNKDDLSGHVNLIVNGKPTFRANIKDGNIKIIEFPQYHEVQTPMANNFDDEDEDLTDFDDLDDDFDLDDETFTDTSTELEEETETSTQNEEAIPSEGKSEYSTQETTKPATPVESKITSPKDIPVMLVVEVGRIQMTMQKFLELEPGNLLELDIHPEDAVDLVIHGKTVAKGELIRVGESLGVRILDLGR